MLSCSARAIGADNDDDEEDNNSDDDDLSISDSMASSEFAGMCAAFGACGAMEPS
jgi:hypothetical protein